MARFPYLPLFTEAWVADTKHLTRLERGTYHDLLVLMWQSPECRVPNDDAWLGKRLGMTPAEVAAELRPIISEFCQSDGNWLTQKRLRIEFLGATKLSRQRTVAANARWNKEKTISKRNAGDGVPRNAPTLPYPTLNGERDARARERVFLKTDSEPETITETCLVSDDGMVIITEAWIVHHQGNFPEIGNLRGQVRLALRLNADRHPKDRERSILHWLSKKSSEAVQRKNAKAQKAQTRSEPKERHNVL